MPARPGVEEAAGAELVAAVNEIRALPLLKRPGIAESIDWAQGAAVLAARGDPWPVALRRSLGLLVKDEEDLAVVEGQAERLLGARD